MNCLKSFLKAIALSMLQIAMEYSLSKVIPWHQSYWVDQFAAGMITAFWALYVFKADDSKGKS